MRRSPPRSSCRRRSPSSRTPWPPTRRTPPPGSSWATTTCSWPTSSWRTAAQQTYYEKAVAAYKEADAILAEQKGTEAKQKRLALLDDLISTYLYLSDYEAATAAYGEVTSLKPDDAQSYFDMATVAISAGDTTTALLAFGKFLELDPTSPEAAQVEQWIEDNAPKSTPTPSPSPTK